MPTDVAMIWAQAICDDARPVIGAANAIPWHVPEDFAHFKNLTRGHPVVMGLATWNSLPRKPLPGRTNVILAPATAEVEFPEAGGDGIVVEHSLEAALRVAAQAPGGELTWVMGGATVYQQVLDAGLADRLEVTDVDLAVAGDTFAPVVDPEAWREAARGPWEESVKGGVRYRFRTLVRR
ncbi:MAG: dihydrofolate reductase [Cellulomonadaceae bacterium]|jgi:dihydrofolate reductase|nr:dihydrofolate reductase [Cellulomonadaceae bacterium]